MNRILIVTSTLPVSDTDPVPAFVKDQAIWIKKIYPDVHIDILAPHNNYSDTKNGVKHKYYDEFRFHYFWPFRWELVAGRGIAPALRKNKLLYLQIPFLFLGEFIAVYRYTRKLKPDLIYAHWFTPQAITASFVSKLTKTPFVFTTHASDVSILKKLPFAKRLVASVCHKARAITAVSPRTADKLQAFFSEAAWKQEVMPKFHVVPMGVEAQINKVPESLLEKVKREYSLPRNKKIILFLGRLAEKKGVSYLIKAFSELSEDAKPAAHLVIAGDGQLKKRLEAQAQELQLNNITFTGYVQGESKEALLALADFVCLPSIIDDSGDSEGLPVVLMEALAMGKIVLASNVTGAELILEHGKSGFIFAEKSADQIKTSIIQALELTDKEETSLKQEAKKLAGQFSWDTIVKKHYQIFDKALNENTHN